MLQGVKDILFFPCWKYIYHLEKNKIFTKKLCCWKNSQLKQFFKKLPNFFVLTSSNCLPIGYGNLSQKQTKNIIRLCLNQIYPRCDQDMLGMKYTCQGSVPVGAAAVVATLTENCSQRRWCRSTRRSEPGQAEEDKATCWDKYCRILHPK